MKRSLKGLLLSLKILIIELIAVHVPAQTVEETYALSCDLMKYEQYEYAVKTLQRVLFFGKDPLFHQAYKNIADCYFFMKDYDRAAKYYDLAYFAEDDEILKMALILKKSSALLLERKFNLALAELYNLPDSTPDSIASAKFLLLGIANFGAGYYESSKQAFEQFAGQSNPETIRQIDAQFHLVDKAGKIKPKTARILSAIFPGSGQFYAGDLKNGFNSLLLTGGLAVLTVYVAVTFSLFDAFISILPWYQRYYTGGIKKAAIIAQSKTETKKATAYREIIHEISKTRAGHSPK